MKTFLIIIASIIVFVLFINRLEKSYRNDKSDRNNYESDQYQKYQKHKNCCEKVGYYKKEVRNGGHIRIFSFAIIRPVTESELLEHAKSQTWYKGSATYAHYFDSLEHTPDVTLIGMEYPTKYDQYLVFQYSKFTNGNEDYAYVLK